MLAKPPQIAGLSLASPELSYPWSDARAASSYLSAGDELASCMAPLSFRGLTALALASAEWIAWRFEGIDEDEDHSPYTFTLCYLEAAWAGNVHMAYMRYIEPHDEDWRGSARGPLKVVLSLIVELMYGWRDHDEPERYPAAICALARLVLPEDARGPFERWLDGSVARLLEHARAEDLPPVDDGDDQAGDPRGTRVPRELFDPSRPFDPSAAQELLDAFIGGLEPERNPFLHSAEEIDEFDDWEGTISRIRVY